MAVVPCLDEKEAVQFAAGLLDAEREREVEEHASTCADCRWLLSAAGTAALEERAPGEPDTGPGRGHDDVEGDAVRPGEVLNNTYVIDRLIGRGGTGSVFEASHLRLPRRFAVKLLSSADPDAIGRLRLEAEVASRLAHPHLVEIFDFNHTPDGVPFLVMELLQGEPLAARLHRECAIEDPAQLMAIAGEICSALAALHAKGIVHRDLEPNNIFLCQREGRVDYVKVMDLGISGAVIGSPSCLAPEQATGKPSDVDQRADVFALGAILFRMLAGQAPWEADSVPSLLHKIANEAPEPTPRWQKVPEPVREAILHALRNDPAARPQQVTELWAELVEATARCGWAGAPARRAAPRRRCWVILALLGVLGAAALGAWVMMR